MDHDVYRAHHNITAEIGNLFSSASSGWFYINHLEDPNPGIITNDITTLQFHGDVDSA